MLNYRNSIVLLAMSFLLVFSCKKNETEDADNSSTNNNDTTVISPEYGVIYCSITGMDNMNGQMVIGLMNDANEWSKGEDGTAFQQHISAFNSDPMIVLFDSLEAGTYAIKLYHDENSNVECDMNWMGMPTEKFGFSNNPSLGMSEPSFSECSFSVAEGDTTSVDLELRNVFL